MRARHLPDVFVTDVTLREHGQNVPAEGLDTFSPEARASFAHALRDAGVRRMEVLSCVSPRVAPAMARDQLQQVLAAMGPMSGVEIVTLVPNLRGYEAFLGLGLGPDGLGHTVGVFHSAMDEHNLPNLGRTVSETVGELRRIASRAASDGVRLSSYVSAAFGYAHRDGLVPVPIATLCDQVRRQFDMGSVMVTLSDLQGLADDEFTARIWDLLLNMEGGAFADRLGYHPHHARPDRAVARIETAYRAGVRHFDTSVRAVGGCVTGAPGNAPTEGVLTRLDALGARTGIDTGALADLAPGWLVGRRSAIEP